MMDPDKAQAIAIAWLLALSVVSLFSLRVVLGLAGAP